MDFSALSAPCQMNFNLELYSGYSNARYANMRVKVNGVVIPDEAGNTSYFNEFTGKRPNRPWLTILCRPLATWRHTSLPLWTALSWTPAWTRVFGASGRSLPSCTWLCTAAEWMARFHVFHMPQCFWSS